MIQRKTTVQVLAPAVSTISCALRRAGWEFARHECVIRTDGYAVHEKRCRSVEVDKLLDFFERRHVTAWVGRA